MAGNHSQKWLAIVFFVFPAAAGAWSLNGVSWNWQDHRIEDPFRLDTGEWPADAGPPDDIEDRFLAAMDGWNQAGLDLRLEYGGRISDGDIALDGHWDLTYLETSGSSWGGALAFAGTWSWDENGDGIDCDIVFLSHNQYGPVLWSSDPAGGGGGRYDIEAVAIHELGHCIGLDHASASSSVMYAYYNGVRTLSADDIAGAQALNPAAPCVDGDGDGVSDCNDDCDDENAAVFPGAGELCNGVDDDCDGVVDGAEWVDVPVVTSTSYPFTSDWFAAGNAFRVDKHTLLVRVQQPAVVTPGSRLGWSVWESSDGGGTWQLRRSERAEATADAIQVSPDLMMPLVPGTVVAVQLGVFAENAQMKYRTVSALPTVGPLTALGFFGGRALGDQSSIDPTHVLDQTLTLVDDPDPDGDGETALCGDCAPDDPSRWSGAVEVCNDIDDDCDGVVDNGFLSDRDGDGVRDCLDACPDDATDDRDADGICDSEDACPDDPANDGDGDGICDSSDDCPDDSANDQDGDGICDGVDPCPNDAQNDVDGDGQCTADDPCPDDPSDACADGVGDTGAVVGGSANKAPRGCATASGAVTWTGMLLLVAVGIRQRMAKSP